MSHFQRVAERKGRRSVRTQFNYDWPFVGLRPTYVKKTRYQKSHSRHKGPANRRASLSRRELLLFFAEAFSTIIFGKDISLSSVGGKTLNK